MTILAAHSMAVLPFALILDALIGDPDWLWRPLPHPVVWIGRLIGWLDARLNRGERAGRRKLAGIAALSVLALSAILAGWALHFVFLRIPVGVVLEVLAVAILLAQRSLYDHVLHVRDAFAQGGLVKARLAIAMIVGRDPDVLDEAGVCRAAIETTAENFSDGVVAPVFWYLLGGLPGLFLHKAVNTADSMIGHRTPRHEAFGWAAARLDDVMNLLPARLAGLMIIAATFVTSDRPRAAWQAMIGDARLHRSPNAGWPEAAMAGALGLALAGPRQYAGGMVEDAWMNKEGSQEARPSDIRRALRIFVAACALQLAMATGLAMAVF